MQACHVGPMDDDSPAGKPGAPPRRRRAPRKVTRKSLENAALAYLGRFAATGQSLEKVLMRRVWRAARFHGTDPAEGAELIAAIIQRYREAGLIDDAAFAEARAQTLFDRGLPLRAIALRLRQKGVGSADIDGALAKLAQNADVADGDGEADARALDRAAARAFAKRRRLGPWRTGTPRENAAERDMAALARAGFSYSVAREVIEGGAEDD